MESSSSSLAACQIEEGEDSRSSIWETMSAALPNVNTTKSLWEVPKLHHEIGVRDDHGENLADDDNQHSSNHRGENW